MARRLPRLLPWRVCSPPLRATDACSSAQQVKQEAEAKAKEAAEIAKKNAAAKTMVADLFGNDDELWLPATAPAGPAAPSAPKASSKTSSTKKVATSSMFEDDDDDSDDGLFG